MGKKRVFGLVGAFWFGVALSGCETTSGAPRRPFTPTPTVTKNNSTGQTTGTGNNGLATSQQGAGQQTPGTGSMGAGATGSTGAGATGSTGAGATGSMGAGATGSTGAGATGSMGPGATGSTGAGATGFGNLQQPQGGGLQQVGGTMDMPGRSGPAQSIGDTGFQPQVPQPPSGSQFQSKSLSAPPDTLSAPAGPKSLSAPPAPTGTGSTMDYKPTQPRLTQDDGLGQLPPAGSNMGRGASMPSDSLVPPPPSSFPAAPGTGGQSPQSLPRGYN
jgi:hypothetical protein